MSMPAPHRPEPLETVQQLRWRIEELEGILVERPPLFARMALTPREAILAGLLLSRQLVTQEAWNIVRNRPDVDEKVFCITIMSLRRKFAPLGLKIHTSWARGYYMEPADKERLRTLA